nr:alpha/beta hydrolase [Frigidibacter mobilis]
MSEPVSDARRIVLVHGAWSRASTWGEVPARLAALGHAVITPDLPGHGDDPADPASVTLADYAGRLAEILRAGPLPCWSGIRWAAWRFPLPPSLRPNMWRGWSMSAPSCPGTARACWT